MIPKEQKGPAGTTMGDLAEPVPLLDLGRKLSVPQDLMVEELSLPSNRGSRLFQQRQRRVQRFTFEFAAGQRASVAGSAKGTVTGTAEPGRVTGTAEPGRAANSPEGHNYSSERHVSPASSGGPEDVQPAASRAVSVHSPSALAPGYAEPLKGVPPEKFNHTAMPKGYHCPWQEFVGYRDYLGQGRSHTPSLADYRNFNKTPVPFGGPLVGETLPRAGTPFAPELSSGLELLRLRPSFNRVARGWVRHLPESEEL